ncbi:triose-phosphate transporter family-domain-containing protein [Dunaliella salina]|uniref:Triose-phosphate transporter family-domain-containing protein n=1 Tax=Dunaliella salina TaxID=3046 RepID=A0ABQ7H7G1_DUNSA|nr:triose-phosphate transporter family-domain-containing protein [Dunaliella salina]|eukprot:KAF5842787.1 triose-phosphate transporter family-domain-containing protein [Dunaliella salina]
MQRKVMARRQGNNGGSQPEPLNLYTLTRNLGLILSWYILSTTLGLFNKALVGKDGLFGKGAFPAPLLMSSTQFFIQALLAKAVFYSRVIERTARNPMSWREYIHTIGPNGVTTGLDVGLSNLSLAYITMSFYTMCKSTVPVFLLLFAFIWRTERPSWALSGVVLIISIGLALLVMGETAFNGTGFVLVMVASCMSGFRFTLTQVFLQGHQEAGALGGPLEMLELLTPVMCVTTLLISVASERLEVVLPGSPYFSSLEHTAITFGIISLGAALAFMMVWTEYKVIHHTSALTLIIAGTAKEIFSVFTAMLVFGDQLTTVNGLGLGIVICGVCLFNYHKYTKNKEAAMRRAEKASDRVEMEPLIIASSSGQPQSLGEQLGPGGNGDIMHAKQTI